MHSEYFFVNDGCNGETIEAISESFPEFNVVSSLALVVESINSVDTSTLVVAAKNKKVFWVFDLVGQEQTDGLQRLFASVDIVAQKEVVGFWRKSTILKETQ